MFRKQQGQRTRRTVAGNEYIFFVNAWNDRVRFDKCVQTVGHSRLTYFELIKGNSILSIGGIFPVPEIAIDREGYDSKARFDVGFMFRIRNQVMRINGHAA